MVRLDSRACAAGVCFRTNWSNNDNRPFKLPSKSLTLLRAVPKSDKLCSNCDGEMPGLSLIIDDSESKLPTKSSSMKNRVLRTPSWVGVRLTFGGCGNCENGEPAMGENCIGNR